MGKKQYVSPEIDLTEGSAPKGGNYGLPFGLCKKYGIAVGEGWTPRDAWDALKGIGITPENAYKDLKKEENKKKTDIGNKFGADDEEQSNKEPKKIEKAESLTYYTYEIKLQGVNKKGQEIILEALNDLADYPINKLAYIDAGSGKKYLAKANGGHLTVQKAHFNGKSGVSLDLKPFYETELKLLKERVASGKTFGYEERQIKKIEYKLKFDRYTVSGNNNPKATIYHEYGHILADQHFGQINGDRYCNLPYEERRNKRLLVEETMKKARETGDIYKLSEYADSDVAEFYAEAFAAKRLGEKLPDYIEDMFRRTL